MVPKQPEAKYFSYKIKRFSDMPTTVNNRGESPNLWSQGSDVSKPKSKRERVAKGDVVSLHYQLVTPGGEIRWHLNRQPSVMTIRKMSESRPVEWFEDDARYKLWFCQAFCQTLTGWVEQILRDETLCCVWVPCYTYLTSASSSQ